MKFIFILLILTSLTLKAEDISKYKYYLNNDSYIIYIKKNDPCIYGSHIKSEIKKYCEMGNSGLNLESDLKEDVYATELLLIGATLRFVVAAHWKSQKCEIYLPKNRLTCEPTGK